jgi:hypothetical protein
VLDVGGNAAGNNGNANPPVVGNANANGPTAWDWVAIGLSAAALADSEPLAVVEAETPGGRLAVGVVDSLGAELAVSEPLAVSEAEAPIDVVDVGVSDGVAAAVALGTAVTVGESETEALTLSEALTLADVLAALTSP